jgi:hypothetical protein
MTKVIETTQSTNDVVRQKRNNIIPGLATVGVGAFCTFPLFQEEANIVCECVKTVVERGTVPHWFVEDWFR